MWTQQRNVIHQCVPESLFAYLIILMHQVMAHSAYYLPWHIWVRIHKNISQSVCCFTNNLSHLHNAIISYLVRVKILKCQLWQNLHQGVSICSKIWHSLSLSLTVSLIYQDSISVSRFDSKRHQCAFFHQIDLSSERFLQLLLNADYREQSHSIILAIILNHNIHIAVWPLLSTRETSKHPSLLHRFCLEALLNNMCHVALHDADSLLSACKVTHLFSIHQKKSRFFVSSFILSGIQRKRRTLR